MKDIPEEVLKAAYARLTASGFKKSSGRDVVAVIVAQAVMDERERATAHASTAKETFRNSADGSPELEVVAASSLFELIERNIRDGIAA